MMMIVFGFIANDSIAKEKMTMVSWGGAYRRATELAVNDPFMAETGLRVAMEDFNGGLAEIRSQVESGNVYWDVVDLEAADAVRACDEGLLEYVAMDEIPLGANGESLEQDFLSGTLTDCGVGFVVYSTVYAYNQKYFPNEKPSTVEDFFDIKKFPGRRGMRRVPHVNLEFALLADGVSADEVYSTLGTPEGLNRAFSKLDTIKDHVVWWEAGAQPPQMLADGEVVMCTAYNGRIFDAQVIENQPFSIVWDGQVLDHTQLGIVAGSPNLETARRFLAFAARPESMAGMSKYIAYSPVRYSAQSFVTTHEKTGTVMASHMPVTPDHMVRAIHNDWVFWADYGDEIQERFAAWLAR